MYIFGFIVLLLIIIIIINTNLSDDLLVSMNTKIVSLAIRQHAQGRRNTCRRSVILMM